MSEQKKVENDSEVEREKLNKKLSFWNNWIQSTLWLILCCQSQSVLRKVKKDKFKLTNTERRRKVYDESLAIKKQVPAILWNQFVQFALVFRGDIIIQIEFLPSAQFNWSEDERRENVLYVKDFCKEATRAVKKKVNFIHQEYKFHFI